MKKIVSMLMVLVMMVMGLTACSSGEKTSYTVGVCQLMEHDSLDAATQGFVDSLTAAMEKAGKEVTVDVQVAGGQDLCTTVINTLTAKRVDLIMANATPALLAAANGTDKIPVLGTSVTDYEDTFAGSVPANVSGTSDAVPFDEQARMMIETLNLTAGDKVGVLYCSNESNSLIQYEAVKALFEAEGIVVNAYTFSEASELQAVVNAAASDSKAIYVPSDNTVAQNDSVVGTICMDKNVPVYTSYASTICYASLAIDYYELGAMTGEMAADVLLGKCSVEDIEVAVLEPAVVYNEEICAALGITVPQN